MKRFLTIILLLFSLISFSQDGLVRVGDYLLTDSNGSFINFFPVPRENLTAKFDTTYKNASGDLLNLVGGNNAVYVSGTGLDAIYDFSGLNDLRLNKNAYLGNSFSLPEYYDYPYSASIYFDTGNPYHWKLTDFHYANFLEQSLTVDNIAFLKAKATTNTSNVIASVSELFIYSTALSSNNLAQIKNYIGIQTDFYGDELFLNGNFETDLSNWNNLSCDNLTRDTNDPISGVADMCIDNTDGNKGVSTYLGELQSGSVFDFSFKYIKESGYLGRYKFGKSEVVGSSLLGGAPSNNNLDQIEITEISEQFTITETSDAWFIFFTSLTTKICSDDYSLKQFYQNYYKAD